jgi:RNA polymerase sigma-70 factor (ECF subfamily)
MDLTTATPRALDAGDAAPSAEDWLRARTTLLRYVAARIGDAHEAEDVVQECLFAAAIRGFQGADPLPLLLGIARFKTVDWWRSRGRSRSVPCAELPERAAPADGPAEIAERRETAAQARALLQTLPERDAELLLLRMAGCSAAETAAALSMTEGAVRVAQHRALARLRIAAGIAEAESG